MTLARRNVPFSFSKVSPFCFAVQHERPKCEPDLISTPGRLELFFLRKRLLSFAAKERVGVGLFPQHFDAFAGNFPSTVDFLVIKLGWTEYRHHALPGCAGGSATGLSGTDAYGQSLGR